METPTQDKNFIYTFTTKFKGMSVKCTCKPYAYTSAVHFEFFSPLISCSGYRSHFILAADFLDIYKDTEENYLLLAQQFTDLFGDTMVRENPNLIKNYTQPTLF